MKKLRNFTPVMHDLEPYYYWRNDYSSEQDELSPFHGREYDEFAFTNKVYNYFIHPQWDEFGSLTLYAKLLFVDYDEKFAILEFIGEWNDTLYNDIMFLKEQVIDPLMDNGIVKFVLICENVLNFHGSDDCYYEDWSQDVMEEGGWIAFLNILPHVEEEMLNTQLQYYVLFGDPFNDFNWRRMKPVGIMQSIELLQKDARRRLR